MRAAFLIAICFVVSSLSRADEPLPAPTFKRFASASGEIVAYATPGSDTRVLRSVSGEELWKIPGWHRDICISNDGLHAATVYDGLNLIPLDSSPEFVLVTLWTSGKKSGEIKLSQIAPSLSILRRTISHLDWGTVVGFNDKNELVIERTDGKRFRFSTDGTPR